MVHKSTPEIADLCQPWNNSGRFDRSVLGAIELAFLRGKQAGAEADRGEEEAELWFDSGLPHAHVGWYVNGESKRLMRLPGSIHTPDGGKTFWKLSLERVPTKYRADSWFPNA